MKEDANPFVSEGTESGLMGSPVLPPLLLIGFRPERLLAGGVGEFLKGLPQEFGASPPPVYPAHLAAPLRDRRDAGKLLEFLSA
jgi:hypothetical protein